MPTPQSAFQNVTRHEMVTLEGEVIRCTKAGPLEIMVPKGSDPGQGFWPLTVWTKSIHVPERIKSADHRRVTVTGMPHIGPDAQVALIRSHAKVSPLFGPYTSWRKKQAELLQLDPDERTRRHLADDIVGALRSSERTEVVWLGRESTHAFSDATRTLAGGTGAVRVMDCPLQGPSAVEEIRKALHAVPASARLVVLSRGGGSPTDLTIFDDAKVLLAVRHLQRVRQIPVLCAIGHDTDRPLLEIEADYAMATPSQVGSVLRPLVTKSPTNAERREADARERAVLVAEHSHANAKLQIADASRTRLQSQLDRAEGKLRDTQARAAQTMHRHRLELGRLEEQEHRLVCRARYRAQCPWSAALGVIAAISLLQSGWPALAAVALALALLVAITLYVVPRVRERTPK